MLWQWLSWNPVRAKDSRRRRLLPAIWKSAERLEGRQLLVAGWSDGRSFGPLYLPQSEMPTSDTATEFASHESDPHEPHILPLPKNWQPDRRQKANNGVLHALSELPQLNSFPEASVNLFLDFDGHFQAEWGSVDNIETPAFSTDNDPTTFSDEDLAAIAEIFARVAEDFAPFNINVTTVEPADLGNLAGIRIAIGGRFEDWLNSPAGGIAFVDSFTNNQPNTAYVFSDTLAEYHNIAEASSHEAGHAFGLSHQSEYNSAGKRIQEYYPGDETGAPIMGLSYGEFRSRWWNGTSSSPQTIQADLDVLSRPQNVFGYRTDDHGSNLAAATILDFTDNRATEAGIIERMDDVDVFRLDVLQADQYRIDYHAADVGANLDVHVQVRTADGTLINERTTFHENSLAIGLTFEPGTYQILIQNNGTYGSLGQYRLQVTQGNDPSLPPTSPGEFEGRFISPASAAFSWVDALGETQYVLHARRQIGKKAEHFSETIPADASSYLLAGHGTLDGWVYELTAVNAKGSSRSDTITPTEFPITAPDNVQAIPFTLTSLAVSWNPVSSAFAYLVRIAKATDPETVLQDMFVDGTRTATVLSDLQRGEEYLVTVTARNSTRDASQTPISVELPDAPGSNPILPPADVTGTAPDPFSVQLSWSAVTGATLFQIQQRRGKHWITIKVVPGSTQQVDLLPDGDSGKAQFRIVAANGSSSATSKTIKVRRPRASGAHPRS